MSKGLKSALIEVLRMGVYILIVLLLTYLFITFVAQRTEVKGSSMYNTLEDGDSLLVDKISYRFQDPERFDIIVFPFQHAQDTYYIKRIIGLPGETVRIDEEGTIYINGEILEENFGYEVIKEPGLAEDEILLGENEYFVMGDNRNNSTDSRSDMVGNIRRDKIVGKAFIRILPFAKFGKIDQ